MDKWWGLKVCVAGKYDPLHSGHIDNMIKARELGSWLVVITHPDDIIKAEKGYCLMPLKDRIAVLSSLKYVDEVVVSIDKDGTCAETIKKIKPDKLVKGGDRTSENMPQNEVDACREVGCEIIYGQGRLLNSSTNLFERAVEQYNANRS